MAVAVGAGVVAVLVVALSIGLPFAPSGAGDNGDGRRLYCGAGLSPGTPDGRANWKGGVVLGFATGAPTCPDPIASSALPLLRIATAGSGATWSLARLGVLYALAVGAVTAAAAWALRPSVRLLLLLPPLLPLAAPTFSRFFVSTFSEPAGLLGAYTLVLGVGVVAGSARTDRSGRLLGLGLLACGGWLAAAAKTAYLPLLVVAALVGAATVLPLGRPARGRDHLVGVAAMACAVLLALPSVLAGARWQEHHFAAVNAHNLVYTAVLPGVGDAALGPLGLPPAAATAAGRAYYPDGIAGVPGAAVVAADPARARTAAYGVLVAHPLATARLVGVALTATLGAALTYLPSTPWTPSAPAPVLGTTVGEQGAHGEQLRAWLDGLAAPWLPTAVVVVSLLLGLLTGRRSGGGVGIGTALCRTAAFAAVAAVVLAIAAVLGDGFFEIAKHVWLSAYLLQVAAVAAVAAGVVAGGPRLARPRRQPVSTPPSEAPSAPFSAPRSGPP